MVRHSVYFILKTLNDLIKVITSDKLSTEQIILVPIYIE